MSIEYNSLFVYLGGIVVLLFLGRILLGPIKIALKIGYKLLLGGVLLLIFNFLGNIFDFNIPLNPLNALILGVLGIPGLGLLILMKIYLE